jgi:hypothetical protein
VGGNTAVGIEFGLDKSSLHLVKRYTFGSTLFQI